MCKCRFLTLFVFLIDVEYKAQVNVSVEETGAKPNLSLIDTGKTSFKLLDLHSTHKTTVMEGLSNAYRFKKTKNVCNHLRIKKICNFFVPSDRATPIISVYVAIILLELT